MNQYARTRLIRYGAVCGGLFLLAFIAWLFLWRIDQIQTALVEMKQVTDYMARQEAYYWVGQVISVSAMVLAGAVAVICLILEEPVLKAGSLGSHKKRRQEKQTGSQSWLVSFVVLFVVQALFFKSNSLTSELYITPILFFVTAAVWLVYRIWCWHGVLCSSEPECF